MSAKDQHPKQGLDWQSRYEETSRDYVQLEKRYEEHAELLQRLVSRIHLNNDPEDEDFQKVLSDLRRKLNGTSTSLNVLKESLTELDKILLAQDEKRQQAELNEASAPSVKAEEPAAKGGFWSRLVKNKSGKDETTQKPEASSPTQDEQIEQPTSKDLDNDLDAIPGYAAIADRIGSTINNLLDQLSFPETAESRLQKLRKRIMARINWYELPPTIEDLSSLVISAVGRGQKTFDGFLETLNDQVTHLNNFFEQQADHENSWQELNETFADQVKEHSSSLETTSREAKDMGDIQSSIISYVQEMTAVAEKALKDGKDLSAEHDKELAQMQSRMSELEDEADGLRARLSEERSRSLTDSLTDLPNRESYDERIEMELDRFTRYGKDGLLAIADIDHFKKINDTYGHLSGDKALQIVGKEIKRRLRKTDFIARYGGEEFVLILPHTDLETGLGVIDKARQRVSEMPFHFRSNDVTITMSFGVAAFEKDITPAKLFDNADKALYEAKSSGRNAVKHWQG